MLHIDWPVNKGLLHVSVDDLHYPSPLLFCETLDRDLGQEIYSKQWQSVPCWCILQFPPSITATEKQKFFSLPLFYFLHRGGNLVEYDDSIREEPTQREVLRGRSY